MNYPDDFINKIIYGDCLEVLKEIPDNCVDAIITDPPAGISMIGKTWDTFDKKMFGRKGGEGENDLKVKKDFDILPRYGNANLFAFQDFIYQVFSEAIRVLKPGGYALVWAIPRTSHHTAMGIERAGFEIKDKIYFIFGSGFPKSLNIGKAVDKLQGNKRKIIGRNPNSRENCDKTNTLYKSGTVGKTDYLTHGDSPYEGWGTSLKPAVEEWILARKPISEKTVAHNVLKWGTGGLNINGCRIDFSNNEPDKRVGTDRVRGDKQGLNSTSIFGCSKDGVQMYKEGRFPSHLVIDSSEEVEKCFPNKSSRFFQHCPITEEDLEYNRIFYGSKASKKERNMGGINNIHPTCKNLSLMRYLCRLITPKNGIVLDMFAGSGSTLIAAKQEGFKYIGIEKEEEYVKIAEARLKATPSPLL